MLSPRYACDGGVCVGKYNGPFTSATCDDQCTSGGSNGESGDVVSYTCKDGACVEVAGGVGNFGTPSCGHGCYQCKDGGCVKAPDNSTDGTFADCGTCSLRYTCVNNRCTQVASGTGSFNESTCNGLCA